MNSGKTSPASHRRAPLPEPVILQVRVDLDGATPPIWRRLEMRSDLTLDRVHEVLQGAFAWWNYHLYMFSLGAPIWDREGEKFLCPFDVKESETEGIPASEVRIDETMQEPGDVLHYIYDYGDNWELTLKLEKVLPLLPDSPPAVCTDGERAAPPEDCGSLRDAESLAKILPDPAAFDPAEVNEALADPDPVLTATAAAMEVPREVLTRLPQRLVEILYQATRQDPDLDERIHRLNRHKPQSVDVEQAVAPFTKFLHLVGDGVKMTAAGYIPPKLVKEVADFLPSMSDWIFPVNREENSIPVWMFREATQDLGLVRKYRGELVVTAAGRKLAGNPPELWTYLAQRLSVPRKAGTEMARRFNLDAVLVTLFYVATGADMGLEHIAKTLRTVRWASDGGDLQYAVMDAVDTTRATLEAVGHVERATRGFAMRYEAPAQELALAALEAAAAREAR